MKKIKIDSRNFEEKQVLTREQLKNILGGWDDGTTNDYWHCNTSCSHSYTIGSTPPVYIPGQTYPPVITETQTGICVLNGEGWSGGSTVGGGECNCAGLYAPPPGVSDYDYQPCAGPVLG